MTVTTPAISVKHLTVILDDQTIIDDISFDVPRGQTTAIIGPNGAGKSVLVKSILGLLPSQHGTVQILGTDHKHYRKIASQVSYIPQSIEVDKNFPLTVRGLFLLKSPQRFGMSSVEEQRMNTLLKLVSMTKATTDRLNTLSGGQIQRVLLAYSLVNKPTILILDEPAAGIDISGQETIYALLQRIQEQRKLTLLLISHELDVVMRYANQVLCLNKKLLCAGLPREVLSNELLTEMYGQPVGHFKHNHA